jgi:hypothetical protein
MEKPSLNQLDQVFTPASFSGSGAGLTEASPDRIEGSRKTKKKSRCSNRATAFQGKLVLAKDS